MTSSKILFTLVLFQLFILYTYIPVSINWSLISFSFMFLISVSILNFFCGKGFFGFTLSKRMSQNLRIENYLSLSILLLVFLLMVCLCYESNSLITITDIKETSVNIIHNVIPNGSSDSQTPIDPVRYWPNGVAQSMSTICTGLSVYYTLSKLNNVSPRLRVLSSLGAMGATATTIAYHATLENSVGFNRLMVGLTEYSKTGTWPRLDQYTTHLSDSEKAIVESAVKKADDSLVKSYVKEAIDISNNTSNSSSNLLDSTNLLDYMYNSLGYVLNNTHSFFKPVESTGYLDDLIGQQIAIYFILFFTTISLILLLFAYILNNILMLNKNNILNRFKNIYILKYLQFQSLMIKISLIWIPLLMLLGLLIIAHGFHFLITHPLPLENLGIDLHINVSNSGSTSINK